MAKRRIRAAVLVFAFLFVLVSSFSFVALEADHDCIGENCRICCQITACGYLIRSFAYFAVLLFIFAAAGTLYVFIDEKQKALLPDSTLVSLKVKLSD